MLKNGLVHAAVNAASKPGIKTVYLTTTPLS
jgi:N-acetylglutamate synthase-like GNAT family acetyltransferase